LLSDLRLADFILALEYIVAFLLFIAPAEVFFAEPFFFALEDFLYVERKGIVSPF